MPRVYTAKAGKDYPEQGIKKGDKYYYWSFFRQPTIKSKTPPRRSQITGSENLASLYRVQEALEDAIAAETTPEGIADAIDTAITDAQDVREQFEETISNLEESFTGGCPAIDDAQEKIDAIEAWESDLESAKAEIEQLDAKDYLPEGNDSEEASWDDLDGDGQANMLEAAREIAIGASLEV